MIGNIVYNRFMASSCYLWRNMNGSLFESTQVMCLFARYIISVFVIGIGEDNNEQGECWDN